MKSIDQANWFLSNYSVLRKTSKWTKINAVYIINNVLFNSHIVIILWKKKKITCEHTLKDTEIYWLTDKIPYYVVPNPEEWISTTEKRHQNPMLYKDSLMNTKKHTLEHIVGIRKHKNILPRCCMCSIMKICNKLEHGCKFCNVPLHKRKHCEKYHTLKHNEIFHIF